MEAFLLSTGIVALAEMGDKTQLLSLVLAARFRKPWPIIWGILVATLLNHALAGAVGAMVMAWVGPEVMRWVLGLSFVAMAVWILVPDQIDDSDSDTSSTKKLLGLVFMDVHGRFRPCKAIFRRRLSTDAMRMEGLEDCSPP